jgi:hypothetical protein
MQTRRHTISQSSKTKLQSDFTPGAMTKGRFPNKPDKMVGMPHDRHIAVTTSSGFMPALAST